MLSIKINGRNYDHFSNVNIELNYDALASTFSFDGFFDDKNTWHRDLFRPLQYHSVQIYEDKTLLITGWLLSHKFNASANNSLVPLSGYSKTGILGDISIPTDLYPLETNQKSLKDIAIRLIEPFGIGLMIDKEVEEDSLRLYDKSNSDGKGSIGSYLAELACQRNIIVTHTASGDLRFTRPRKSTASIATYTEGMPSVEIGLSINGQGMHSQVEVLRQGTVGSDIEGSGIKKNPLIGQFRPLVKEQTKGGAGDAENASNNAISAELKNISLTVQSDRWTWFSGKVVSIIRPNNYITVQAPKCFLSRPSNWFVQKVVLSETDSGRTAVLTCVMPETFNNEDPKNIFT